MQVSDWKHGAIWTVLVASYETVRKYAAELAGTSGLLICDEGHRLKAAQGNKTISKNLVPWAFSVTCSIASRSFLAYAVSIWNRLSACQQSDLATNSRTAILCCADALLKLECPRRIILTGTPVQNNLDEFFGESFLFCSLA